MTDDRRTMGQGRARPRHRLPADLHVTVFKLLVASLIAGIIMSLLGLTPLGLLHALTQHFEHLFDSALSVVRGAVDYVLLGATVVVPVWLIVRLLSYRRH